MKNCLLGISPASEHYKPTFRNSVSVPSSAGGEVYIFASLFPEWFSHIFALYTHVCNVSTGFWWGNLREGGH